MKKSARQGTRAAQMDCQIPEPVKAQRSSCLLELSERLHRAYAQSFLGERVEVLAEKTARIGEKTYWTGHTANYLPVAFETKECCANEFRMPTIRGLLDGGILLGKL